MRRIVLLLTIACLLLSCNKDDALDEGIETKVFGRIYDTPNDIPFENLKLKIAEYKTDPDGLFVSYDFVQFLDSTYTDSNGNYDFTFETSGAGNYYRLFVEEDIDIWTYLYDAVPIEIGLDNKWDFDFLHLYPVNLLITLNNIEYTPVHINSYIYPHLESIEITNSEIIRTLYTDKNTDTQINFRRETTPNVFENYSVIVPASNTIESINFSINIENSDFN
ncbi:hypothetical protein [Olleya sp. Bg11-27]|uniref:hypothetical protein n=1 Tax=Olleya sp. Bg11-27 TaxID=2058135 RepID=UPI000C31A96F|nr:hypothetical protein [Olleya sp. Bg11-27]AUC75673.1 hypothetical protein CW732_08300 [Olleya sp. Bg11-27]